MAPKPAYSCEIPSPTPWRVFDEVATNRSRGSMRHGRCVVNIPSWLFIKVDDMTSCRLWTWLASYDLQGMIGMHVCSSSTPGCADRTDQSGAGARDSGIGVIFIRSMLPPARSRASWSRGHSFPVQVPTYNQMINCLKIPVNVYSGNTSLTLASLPCGNCSDNQCALAAFARDPALLEPSSRIPSVHVPLIAARANVSLWVIRF